jgi:membrane-bound metal-dependent hydrolase YbcI (DUF457 family)
MSWYFITYIAPLIAALIGLKLPDIDLAPVFPIRHRSAWTHGPLPALLIAWLDVRYPLYHFAWIAMLAGVTIHLLADCFPRRWHGMAMINFKPIPRTLGPMGSFWVIAVGALLSGYTAWIRF